MGNKTRFGGWYCYNYLVSSIQINRENGEDILPNAKDV